MSGIQTLGPLVLSHGDRASESLVEYESPSLCVCSSRPDPSSIVAVHGFNGERTTSWTNKSDDTFWLSDVLPGPDHIPSARIMTFGYISESIEVISAEGIRKAALELLKAVMELRNVAQEKQIDAQTDVQTYSEKYVQTAAHTDAQTDVSIDVLTTLTNNPKQREGRPLVFMGHDLGGTIIKQALLIANNENRYLSIAADTSLLIFFGTPHRALTFGDWNNLTINIAAVSLDKPKEVFSEILKSSSKVLMDLSLEFIPFAGGISILNVHQFYSVKDEDTVIDEYSATFEIPNEENRSVVKNHREICTPSADDWLIGVVCGKIQQSMTTARKFDDEGINYLQTFLALNLEIYQPTIPSPDSITTSWIFSHGEYLSWLEHETPAILCLYGKPGSGKSVLSSIVIRNMRLSITRQKRAIVFFFCDDQDKRRHSTRDLLSSLIHQLLVQQPLLFRHVQSLCALKRDKLDWTRQELQVIFRAILYSREHVEIVCIINGLDKCDPSHMQLWEDLVDATTIPKVTVNVTTTPENPADNPNTSEDEGEDTPTTSITESSLKFMITTQSRLEIPTPRGFCFSIEIDSQDGVRGDIKSLLAIGIKDLVLKRPGFTGFEEKITEKLLGGPDATFLTTSLGLGDLATLMVCSAPASIQEKLDSISFELSEIYDRHLRCIPSDWHSWAYEVLSWVLHTARPLTVHELALALAIRPNDKSLSEVDDDISQDMAGDLQRVFGPLIRIEQGEVHLVHPSAKEFLVSHTGAHCWYIFDPDQANERISRTCLVYLSMKEFEDASSLTESDGNTPLVEPRWGFLNYAARHWPSHYRQVRDKESNIHSEALGFLNKQLNAGVWPKLYWSIAKSDPSPSWDSAQHIACELGFTEVAMRLLGTTASDEDTTKALELAARNGHKGLVGRLLEANQDSAEIDQDGTALREAASNGHESVVELLLKHECKPVSRDHGSNGPLALAAQNGHAEIVKMLLGLNADMEPVGSRSIALHLAVAGGHEAVVKILLKIKGIDLERAYTGEYPPLHVAAQYGHVRVVKQLLAHGADPESSSISELTPLHLAAKNGHLNITNQLLTARATIDPLDSGSFTPLHHASQQGHAAVVDFLLDAGADGELTNKFRETPLHLAVQRGHTKVMEELLDFGVEVNTKRRDGWTPLHVGVRDGRLDAVELLLEAGADIDAKTGKGSTALFLAAELGNVEITKLLLDNGANARQTNKTQSTPLHRASQKGNLGVVKLLLAAGASPIAKKDNGDTPLGLARIAGHSAILEELDIDHRDKDGRTRMFHACAKESLEEIQALLEAKADVRIKDNDGRGPLDILLGPFMRVSLFDHIEGIEVKPIDGQPPCSWTQGADREYLSCDICDKHINEEVAVFYYHCCKCEGDNYDLCRVCYDDGSRCLDVEHTMRLRVIADRLESYAEYTASISELRWPLVESGNVKV